MTRAIHNSRSLVDVILPARNAASTIDAALQSLLTQTLTEYRIFAIDDSSTDGTGDILRAYAAHDPRIEVITGTGTGIVDALNLGLSHAEAPYFARMDADDFCYPHRLATQLRYLEQHADCVAVGCAVDHIDEYGSPLTGLPLPGDPSNADPTSFPAREPYIIHPFLTARRSAVEQAGRYRYVHNSEDTDLYWRLLPYGTLVNLPDKLGQYRVHEASISGSSLVGGRIMAINSQLSALSALRRAVSRPDIVFEPRRIEALKQAQTLEGMWGVVSSRLDKEERRRLRLASAMKLLELTGYRPYKADDTDFRALRRALADAPPMPAQNRREIDWYLTREAARIAKEEGWLRALSLTSPRACARALAKARLGQSAGEIAAETAMASKQANQGHR